MVEIDVLFLEVPQKLRVHPLDHFLDPHERLLDARPGAGVVIQYPIEDLAQAVVAVPLDALQLPRGELVHLRGLEGVQVEFDVLGEEHYNEGGDDVVDALDVAAGRMPHVPHVQQSSWGE